MSAYVVINLRLPFSGIEIEQGQGFRPTKIRIPFMDEDAAWEASRTLDIDVAVENPVIQGDLVAGELEAPDDHDE
jgi:hypothetical protein